MGNEPSKETDADSESAQDFQAMVHSMNYHILHAKQWSLLAQCSLDQWKNKDAGACGFSETFSHCTGTLYKDCSPAFCTSMQGAINISKSSSLFSFRKKTKFMKLAEHFEYNHIPAQLSSIQNFHVKSVLCYRSGFILLHLVRNFMSQFGLIDLNINKFLGVFGKQSAEFMNEAILGEISPDGSRCLIKMPKLHGPTNKFTLNFYDLHTRVCLYELDLSHSNSHFSFDPRYSSSRVAITSYLNDHDSTLFIISTNSWNIVSQSPNVTAFSWTLESSIHDLLHSKDGLLIFAVLIAPHLTCQCPDKKLRRQQPLDACIYVFHADTCETLHCVQYHRYICRIHSCYINFLPAFSHCGTRMALVLNEPDFANINYVQVYKLPIIGMSLQKSCRRVIRQFYSPSSIANLPLPVKLIDYLNYKPQFT